jgi:hypothetical protein
MREETTQSPRSCSVARPIMKDSHSFDSGSNPDGSIILAHFSLSVKVDIPPDSCKKVRIASYFSNPKIFNLSDVFEILLLIKQADVKVPVFDAMETHADAAVKYALNGTY